MHTSFDEGSIHYVIWVIATAMPVAIKTSEIMENSAVDEELNAVKQGVYHQNWDGKAAVYKIFETELCFAGDILLRGNRIVIPEKLRDRVLELAHDSSRGTPRNDGNETAFAGKSLVAKDRSASRIRKEMSRMHTGRYGFYGTTSIRTQFIGGS